MLRVMIGWMLLLGLIAMDIEKKPFETRIRHGKKIHWMRPNLG